MAITKPKIIIDNFTGMGDNGHYFLKGFAPTKINGQSILAMEHDTSLTHSSSTYTDLASIDSATIVTDEAPDNIVYFGSGKMHEFNATYTGDDIGLIHEIGSIVGSIATDDYIYPSNDGDILFSELGNLIYSSASHLGIGYRGRATGGGTTTLVDTGVDFTALEDVTAGSTSTLKVVNVTKGEIHTVTGVAATTLTFDAGSTTNENNDYYYFLVDGKFKFDVIWNGEGEQFIGQEDPFKWSRRIVLWEDTYFILNGNYIATLGLDESTFSATTQQLPSSSNAITMETNGSKFLIATELRGKGELVLWDGKLEGFLNRLKLSQPIECMTPYKDGWLYVMGAFIFYTNGYSTEQVGRFPDLRDDRSVSSPIISGIREAFGNIYVVVSSGGNKTRLKNGLFLFDPANGFTYIPTYNDLGKEVLDGNTWGIFPFYTSWNRIKVSAQDNNSGEYTISNVYTSPSEKASAMFYQKLPDNTSIGLIELNLTTSQINTAPGETTVTVNIGKWNNYIWGWGSIDAANSTTTSIRNQGTAYAQSGNVGDIIWILNGKTGGERATITAVANQGTATETLTISPALSAIPEDDTNFNILRMRKTISRTFSTKDIPDNLSFPVNGFFGNNLFLEVYVEGKPININSIKVI